MVHNYCISFFVISRSLLSNTVAPTISTGTSSVLATVRLCICPAVACLWNSGFIMAPASLLLSCTLFLVTPRIEVLGGKVISAVRMCTRPPPFFFLTEHAHVWFCTVGVIPDKKQHNIDLSKAMFTNRFRFHDEITQSTCIWWSNLWPFASCLWHQTWKQDREPAPCIIPLFHGILT